MCVLVVRVVDVILVVMGGVAPGAVVAFFLVVQHAVIVVTLVGAVLPAPLVDEQPHRTARVVVVVVIHTERAATRSDARVDIRHDPPAAVHVLDLQQAAPDQRSLDVGVPGTGEQRQQLRCVPVNARHRLVRGVADRPGRDALITSVEVDEACGLVVVRDVRHLEVTRGVARCGVDVPIVPRGVGIIAVVPPRLAALARPLVDRGDDLVRGSSKVELLGCGRHEVVVGVLPHLVRREVGEELRKEPPRLGAGLDAPDELVDGLVVRHLLRVDGADVGQAVECGVVLGEPVLVGPRSSLPLTGGVDFAPRCDVCAVCSTRLIGASCKGVPCLEW